MIQYQIYTKSIEKSCINISVQSLNKIILSNLIKYITFYSILAKNSSNYFKKITYLAKNTNFMYIEGLFVF